MRENLEKTEKEEKAILKERGEDKECLGGEFVNASLQQLTTREIRRMSRREVRERRRNETRAWRTLEKWKRSELTCVQLILGK